MAVRKTREGLELRHRWFRPIHVFMVLFCVVWDGVLVFWYSVVFEGGTSWIVALFPLLHVVAGVGLTYWTLAGLFNTTTLRVERRALVVRHSPLPWGGPGAIESGRIEQLYVKSVTHGGRRNVSFTYEVWVVLRDTRAIALVKGLREPEVALYLEQQIERALSLEDRVVPGEFTHKADA